MCILATPQLTLQKMLRWEKDGSEESAVFSCPNVGCVRAFQRASLHEKHLLLEACTKALERQSLSDIAKVKYASLLQEGLGSIPSAHPTSTKEPVISSTTLLEGWALRSMK